MSTERTDSSDDPIESTPDQPSLTVQRTTRKLSHYRTKHTFENYAEFTSVDAFLRLIDWAKEQNLPVFILGNGSNVLYGRRTVKSLVLKNKLPATLEELGDSRIEVSSTLPVSKVLRWCEARGLDSFYYLSSVPATIGGAIAMNAGRGRAHNLTIFDFVVSVAYVENGQEVVLQKSEIPLDYRSTPFTGLHTKLITRVVLDFAGEGESEGKIKERVSWSKQNQDHSAPNCGSVFKAFDGRVMVRLKGLGFAGSSFSAKTTNWLLCRGGRHWPLLMLILLAQLLHRLIGRRAVLELIKVR